jgi:FkbM family methyltransferase
MRGMGMVHRWREGLSPFSQIADRLGRTSRAPRFAGVSLCAPDRVASWGISKQIASGEYALPGMTPKTGDRVVDVGANIGVFALWAVRKGASVTSYEPGPETFDCLVKNTAGRPIEVVHAAIVGRPAPDGTARLYLHDQQSTRNTLLGHEIGSGQQLVHHVDVPAVSIDEVLADACDLMKIDCEGAEFHIFAGANDNVLRQARRIILEFHRTAGDPELLLQRLADAGFDARILEGTDPSESFGVIGAHRVD